MSDGIYVSAKSLMALSDAARREVLNIFSSVELPVSVIRPGAEADEIEQPAELSFAQARKLLDGCGERTSKALRFIASGPIGGVRLSEIASTMGEENPGKLGGVWAGLTRRTRKVLGDSEADLIWWDEVEGLDDLQGYLSRVAYNSLRKAFNID